LQFRQYLEEISDDTEIGNLVDRGVRIVIDRNDRFARLDTGKMLDRAGDAYADIEAR
jgi:hypothetical protein